MTTIRDITNCLESLAPLAYQEDYDNAGLIVGEYHTAVTGILVSLDCTEDVIDEAISKGVNLVVAHHPIVFKGLKQFNGKNYVERAVIKAIKNDIAIYATHTNLDHVQNGVNYMIAERLGLINVRILAPKKNLLKKLVTFIPVENTDTLLAALHRVGAGQIGAYSNCSFSVTGVGRFTPSINANPYIGSPQKAEEVLENRVEVVFPSYVEQSLIQALKATHPYEEVAYYVSEISNVNQEVGAGAIGLLQEAETEYAFLAHLKESMNLRTIRHTPLLDRPIRKVAVCGGAGSFLLKDAIRQGADVFITSDYKYHEFFDADGKIIICDIGHYESEVYTKDLIISYLSEKFCKFAILKSEVNTNPVSYF